MPSLTRRLHFGHHLNAPRTEKWRLPCMFIARCVVWMYGGGSRLVMCLCFVGNQVWVHLLPLLRWAETTDINLFVDLLCITVSWWDLVVAWELRLWCVVCDRDVGVHAQASASWPACYARYFICMTLIVRLWSGCVSAHKLLLLCCCIFISMCAVSDTPPPISLYRACACASFYICVMYKVNGVLSYSKSRVCVIISHPE